MYVCMYVCMYIYMYMYIYIYIYTYMFMLNLLLAIDGIWSGIIVIREHYGKDQMGLASVRLPSSCI